MRLTELDPRWIGRDDRRGLGIHFECPCCRNIRIGVYFRNPLDGGEPENKKQLWLRAGEDFANLSLSPSIDVTEKEHWHGFITNGEVCE